MGEGEKNKRQDFQEACDPVRKTQITHIKYAGDSSPIRKSSLPSQAMSTH